MTDDTNDSPGASIGRLAPPTTKSKWVDFMLWHVLKTKQDVTEEYIGMNLLSC